MRWPQWTDIFRRPCWMRRRPQERKFPPGGDGTCVRPSQRSSSGACAANHFQGTYAPAGPSTDSCATDRARGTADSEGTDKPSIQAPLERIPAHVSRCFATTDK